jgi:hypothetical protein
LQLQSQWQWVCCEGVPRSSSYFCKLLLEMCSLWAQYDHAAGAGFLYGWRCVGGSLHRGSNL